MPLRVLVFALFVPLAVAAQQIALQQVTAGFSAPLGIVSAGDARLFIVQQGGTIAIWDGTRILPTPFLDIHNLISSGNERGLLGLAFHPHYATNGLFFVHYTAPSGDVTIARYSVSADPNRADFASGAVLLTIPHSQFGNHNGGQLQFGPDGYLYIGVGDGGGAGNPSNSAQDLNQLLGKILRIDVDRPPYAIPSGNPFPARGEIWAYGLRNPWRFSFDRETGDLWIGDVGQNLYEEVDLQPAASAGGENYGWRLMEGFHCFNAATCPTTGLTMPILEYSHSLGCSITGGYRYRGARFPRLRGVYFYADYCSGTIWGATQTNGTWSSKIMLTTNKIPFTSFGEDSNGELYVVSGGGTLYQIVDPNPLPPRRRAAKH
ncbi:MAG TPA: PQQ-dependent sugar dehydrogenase [Thermoanaerobaculia bacterium]|nr:PQQ-dependent sugar dehydrogenase [Thermoanaerobaculia bacterium]